MGLSLRDQLLNAGLISEQQAKQQVKSASRQQHERRKTLPKREAAKPVLDEATLARQKAEAEKREQDVIANRKLLEKSQEAARRAEVRQLVDHHKLPKLASDDFFNFIAGKRVKRMPVDAERRAGLTAGRLAIVNCEGSFEIVPAKIAARIAERNPAIVLTGKEGTVAPSPEPAGDDPYKDYVVPDDLVW